ncbi:MAG TPA: inositol monophosphatase family protein [Pirellulales bacterium]|nr:inositol monophosphatase family protein [Pirellulales bacterium]
MQSAELSVAREAALKGGEIVRRYFHEGVEIRTKESFNLVSDADVESEHVIADSIRRAFPGHAVLGEEAHRDDVTSEHLWIVDPLDGTNNFAHKIPHFAVSIAYWRHGKPECGVIYQPMTGDWFTAVRGQGAEKNDQPLRVDATVGLNESLIGVGFYYDRGSVMEATLAAMGDLFRTHIHGIRRFGAATLDLCAVATGQFGAFFEYELSPWDWAAGLLIVEEAGGRVTTCLGRPVPIERTSILATNGAIHDQVLDVVSARFPVQNA